MLGEIDLLRSQGHTIGIRGEAGNWTCEFDASKGAGSTPVDAFMAARDLAIPAEANPK